MTFIVQVKAHEASSWCDLYRSRKELDALRTMQERTQLFPRDHVRMVNGRGTVLIACQALV